MHGGAYGIDTMVYSYSPTGPPENNNTNDNTTHESNNKFYLVCMWVLLKPGPDLKKQKKSVPMFRISMADSQCFCALYFVYYVRDSRLVHSPFVGPGLQHKSWTGVGGWWWQTQKAVSK